MGLRGGRILWTQKKEAWLGLLKPLPEFYKPLGMGEITGSQNPDALELSPEVEVLQVEVLCGSSGEVGMDMQIRDEHERRAPSD
jgi:hypothetical protein